MTGGATYRSTYRQHRHTSTTSQPHGSTSTLDRKHISRHSRRVRGGTPGSLVYPAEGPPGHPVPDSWPRIPQQGNVNVRYFQPRGGHERGTGAVSHLFYTRTSRTIDPSRSRSSKRHPLIEGGPVVPAQLVRWTIKRGFIERTRSGTHPVVAHLLSAPLRRPGTVCGGTPRASRPGPSEADPVRARAGRPIMAPVCPTEGVDQVGGPGLPLY